MEGEKEEELEVDRELPQFTNLPPFEETTTYDLYLIIMIKTFLFILVGIQNQLKCLIGIPID